MPSKSESNGIEQVDPLLAMANTVSTMAGVMSKLAASDDAVPASEVQRVHREATELLEGLNLAASSEASIPEPPVVTAPQVETFVPAEEAPIIDPVEAEANDGKGDGPTHLLHVLGSYSKYVAMFVGAGLVSGSVVHFPLAPTRYAIIGVIGAVLFTAASIVSEFKKPEATALGIVKLGAAALTLSLGIGMMSGGIQHFDDFPDRAAKLIPIGMGVSIVAFIFRNSLRLRRDHTVWLAAGMVWILIMLGFALSQVAAGAGESGGHSHGEAETTAVADEHGTTPTTAATTADNHGTTATTAAAAHDEDSHAH
jgi:hypothetical protein